MNNIPNKPHALPNPIITPPPHFKLPPLDITTTSLNKLKLETYHPSTPQSIILPPISSRSAGDSTKTNTVAIRILPPLPPAQRPPPENRTNSTAQKRPFSSISPESKDPLDKSSSPKAPSLKQHLELTLTINTDVDEYQDTFQEEVSHEVGNQNIVHIEDCKGKTPFLDRISIQYANSNPEEESCNFFSLMNEPSDSTLSAGISNSQVFRSEKPDGTTENLAIVKPALENFSDKLKETWESQPIQREGISYPQMTRNEWLASFLSKQYAKFFEGLDFKVPETHVIIIPGGRFTCLRNENMIEENTDMICSIHEFAQNTTSLGRLGRDFLKSVSTAEITKLAILDILLYNTDRRRHNVLVQNNKTLIPIDHSLIASSGFQDNPRFFWLGELSSNTKFTEEQLTGIAKLEWKVIKNELLTSIPDMNTETLNTLNTSLEFLKIGASLGMTPFELGSLMFRKGEPMEPGSDNVHFAEHCYNSASRKPGDFSTEIANEIKEYLTPCAQLLTDPKYEHLNKIPTDLKEGFRTPLLTSFMRALHNYPENSAAFLEELELEIRELTTK